MAYKHHNDHLLKYLDSHKRSSSCSHVTVDKTDSGAAGSSAVNETVCRQSSSTSWKPGSTLSDMTSGTGNKNVVLRKFALSTHQRVFQQRNVKAFMNILPDELVLKIFDFLTPADLLSSAQVCKRWLSLTSDNFLWYQMFLRYGSRQRSKQKPPQFGHHPPYYWKSKCLSSACKTDNLPSERILQKLKKTNPFTDLPKETQSILEKMSMKWAVAFIGDDNKERLTVFSSDQCYFLMTVCVRWYSPDLNVSDIKRLRFYAARPVFYDENDRPLPNSPCRRSLLVDMEFSLAKCLSSLQPVTSDKMLTLYTTDNGLLFAVWKDSAELAFLTMTFHHHQLVQRCIFGSKSHEYEPPKVKVFRDDVDKRYGLHGYSCTLELRNQRNTLWSEKFSSIFCRDEGLGRTWAVFQLINPNHSFQRSAIAKTITFPYKTTAFTGKLPNACIVDITLINEHGNPMWCSSHLLSLEKSDDANLRYEYDSNDVYQLVAEEQNRGRVVALMIWEESTSQYFMTSLEIHLKKSFINRWFGTKH